MKKNKNEDLYDMEDRVEEELHEILEKYGKITSLTPDQKLILTRNSSSIKEKYINIDKINFDYENKIYDEARHNDDPISIINEYIATITRATEEANAFVIKNKLINVCFGIEDGMVIVGGCPEVAESKLIAEYSKDYLAEKKEEARQLELKRKEEIRASKTRKSAAKTICVDGKKYKLIDEDDCEDC